MKTLDWSVKTLGGELQLAREKLHSLLQKTRVAKNMSVNVLGCHEHTNFVSFLGRFLDMQRCVVTV